MKRVAMWFFLSCKRYMRKWSFLFILLLLPAGVLAAGQAQKKGSQDISIAISVEESGENTLGDALADSLVNRPRGEDAGMFRFYLCRDEEEVKAEVASRRAECGYVIYAGLEEKLDTKSYKRSIGVYSAPSTVAAALSTETVFAALMKIYDGKLLADYVAENELFAPLGAPGGEAREEAAVQVRELYENGWAMVPPSGSSTSSRAGKGRTWILTAVRQMYFRSEAWWLFMCSSPGCMGLWSCAAMRRGDYFFPFHTDTGYPAAWLPWRLLLSWSAYQGFWPCGRAA